MQHKKSLGQNFLKSPKIISDIISAAKIVPGDFVLEIGPGEGILTDGLLKAGAFVTVVEKDHRLIPILMNKFEKEITENKLQVIEADILDLDIKNIFKKNYKIVANIPYYITGQIFRKFLESNFQPTSMTLLVQKEVAKRIVTHDQKESLLSISVKIFGDPKIIRTVPAGAFVPKPKVDSAVLHISNISNKFFKSDTDKNNFFNFLHLGFAHKRKKLFGNLSEKYDKSTLSSAFTNLKIDENVRAENLSVEMWMSIFDRLI